MWTKVAIAFMALTILFMAIQMITVRKEVQRYKRLLKKEQSYSKSLEKSVDGMEVFPTKTKSRNLKRKNEENEKKS